MIFLSDEELAVSNALAGMTPRTLKQRVSYMIANWRQRTIIRRRLAEMDSRSLRKYGISPAAAAYESGKAFWSRLGKLV